MSEIKLGALIFGALSLVFLGGALGGMLAFITRKKR